MVGREAYKTHERITVVLFLLPSPSITTTSSRSILISANDGIHIVCQKAKPYNFSEVRLEGCRLRYIFAWRDYCFERGGLKSKVLVGVCVNFPKRV